MCSTPRIASRFSVIDTGSPAARSSCTKPWSTSSITPEPTPDGTSSWFRVIASDSFAALKATESPRSHRRTPDRGRRVDKLLARLGDVGLVLEEHVERGADHLRVDRAVPEVEQRAGPVDRLGDRRRLLHVER